MKSILIRPSGPISQSTGKRAYSDDAAFDLLSFLTNEFDNQDITAELVEIGYDNANQRVMQLEGKLKALRLAAKHVVACWERGDLASAVRQLDRASEEG
jgi:hypothetical protein